MLSFTFPSCHCSSGVHWWHHCHHQRRLRARCHSSAPRSRKIKEIQALFEERQTSVCFEGVKYLGSLVSTEGIAPPHEYLDRIRACPNPLREINWLLPLLISSFVNVFSLCSSQGLRSLQSLLSKKRTMTECSGEHDECFEADKSTFNKQEFYPFNHEGSIQVHAQC